MLALHDVARYLFAVKANTETKVKDRITISETPSHEKCSHRVRYPGTDGKIKQKWFTNETDALAFVEKQRAELGVNGSSFGTIADDERSALTFWRTFSKGTTPTPPDLLTMMRDFKKSWLASKTSITITDAVAKFITHQEADGSSPRHVASLKSRLGRFSSDNADKLVSSITTGIFTDWLNGLRATRADKTGEKLTAVTRHNLTRTLRSFFVFALERGWALANPVPLAKRSKSKAQKIATRTAPAIMLPSDVARFMDAVQTVKPTLVPFWSLKFFAGVRDAEASRLDWSMIDLASGEIHIPATVSKTGEVRTMKIEANLDAWLRPYAATGPIVTGGTTRKRGFKRIVASLAVKNAKGKITKPFIFPSNAARHSFGTYHLFHFRNAGETALQLGHKSNPAMLHEHYKNPTAEKHAAAFWDIMPTDIATNVTNIKQGRKSA